MTTTQRTIVGRWLEENGKVVASQECTIIDHLTKYHLIKVGERDSGWTQLFFDPVDGSYWERTYPQGHLQGGGTPMLTSLSTEEVRTLYGQVPEV